jgi:hypothetical protein
MIKLSQDFFDIELLKSHRGFHTITMKEFLQIEACQGGLGSLAKGNKGMLPKNNNSELWGQDLWWYLNNVAGNFLIAIDLINPLVYHVYT